MQRTVKTLVLSPTSFVRKGIKECLQFSRHKTLVYDKRGWKAALNTIKFERNVDVIFIYSLIAPSDIQLLQNAVKDLELDSPPIFIMALHPGHLERFYISQQLFDGFEGFIREPFSAEEVNNIIDIVLENRETNLQKDISSVRILQFLVKDALTLVDGAALERLQEKAKGQGFNQNKMRLLKEKLDIFNLEATNEQVLRILDLEIEIQSEHLDVSLFERREEKVRFAEHPGKVITRIIESRNLTQERLCEMLSSDEEQIKRVLGQQEGLTPELATQLSRVLGKHEKYWMGLQNSYERYQEHINS